MKACVVGYGAMGKIISSMLDDELAANVALECKYKALEEVKEDFDVIIDFSNPANLDMILSFVKKTKKPVVFATTGYSDIELAKIHKESYCSARIRISKNSRIVKRSSSASQCEF